MITRLGIYSLLSGLFVFIFSGISSFMEDETIWVDLTISKMLGEAKTESIITWFDTAMIQNSLDFVLYDMPLFALLGSVGLILLLIGLFVKEH